MIKSEIVKFKISPELNKIYETVYNDLQYNESLVDNSSNCFGVILLGYLHNKFKNHYYFEEKIYELDEVEKPHEVITDISSNILKDLGKEIINMYNVIRYSEINIPELDIKRFIENVDKNIVKEFYESQDLVAFFVSKRNLHGKKS